MDGAGTNRGKITRRAVATYCATFLVLLIAATVTSPATGEEREIVIQLFVTANSQPCDQARQCLDAFTQSRKGIAVRIFDVTKDRDALKRIWQLSKRAGLTAPRAPTIYLLDRLRVGFKDEATMNRILNELLTMQVYVRKGCSRCRKAKVMLADIQRRWPAIRIEYHDIVYEPGARQKFETATRRHGVTAAATPTFEFAGRMIVGYQSDQLTGKKLEDILRSGSSARKLAAASYRSSANEHVLAMLFGRTGFGLHPSAAGLRQVGHGVLTMSGVATSHLAGGDLHDLNAASTPEASESRIVLDEQLAEPADGESEAILLPDDFGDEVFDEPIVASETPEGITVPWFGQLRVQDWGMPAFTFLIGLIDGFNPCAMWVLIFLLSVLVNIRSRKRIIAIAGTFVLISGLAYFAFMAAWLNVFRWVGVQRPVQISLGALGIFIGTINIKDFFAFHKGVSLTIPAAARPGIYRRTRDIVQAKYLTAAIAGAVVLAVLVNVVELLCTAGLPALYTQILTMQELPAWANYCYLALYNIAYMLDDALLLTIIVITMSHRKLQEQEGRWLKLLSGTVVLGLGLVMMVSPGWLS